LHSVRRADAGVPIPPWRGHSRRDLLAACCDEPLRHCIAVFYLERESHGPGDEAAGFDLIDRRSLVFVQELECDSAAVERDDAAGLRAPVCKLAQPESVPVEGERLVKLCDGQGDA